MLVFFPILYLRSDFYIHLCIGIQNYIKIACNRKGLQAIYRRILDAIAYLIRLLRFCIIMECLCNEYGTLYRDYDLCVHQSPHRPCRLESLR